MRQMNSMPDSPAAASRARKSHQLPACRARRRCASRRGEAPPRRTRRTSMTTGASTAKATTPTNTSPAWYMRVAATSPVTAMISSRCPRTAGRGNSRVCARRGSTTQITANVASTMCPVSSGTRPRSRSIPSATGRNATAARTARTRLRPVGATPRVGARRSGSTESMTSSPRTTTTANCGGSSSPIVHAMYQASAATPNPHRRRPVMGGREGTVRVVAIGPPRNPRERSGSSVRCAPRSAQWRMA